MIDSPGETQNKGHIWQVSRLRSIWCISSATKRQIAHSRTFRIPDKVNETSRAVTRNGRFYCR